ncbi:hypothetical protein [Pseudomonas syringae]|nr:hypothetical protein [Pseudomonas syringae]
MELKKMGIGDCCSEAMKEVEDLGLSDKFIKHGTQGVPGKLVTAYECKECGHNWTQELDTEEPDRHMWYPQD